MRTSLVLLVVIIVVLVTALVVLSIFGIKITDIGKYMQGWFSTEKGCQAACNAYKLGCTPGADKKYGELPGCSEGVADDWQSKHDETCSCPKEKTQ